MCTGPQPFRPTPRRGSGSPMRRLRIIKPNEVRLVNSKFAKLSKKDGAHELAAGTYRFEAPAGQ